MEKKNLIIIVVSAILVLSGLGLYLLSGDESYKIEKVQDKSKQKVIQENLAIPKTEKISGTEGSVMATGTAAVPIVPKTEEEKVIVPKAVLTAKGAYGLAESEAKKWSIDALPVFIKSLGAVTLDGRSSQWQTAFSSPRGKDSYEIIVQGDKIVSKKRVDSVTKGAVFPAGFQDSSFFVNELQTRPAFSDATLTSFLLASTPESTDVKWWFSINTSKGVVTFEIK